MLARGAIIMRARNDGHKHTAICAFDHNRFMYICSGNDDDNGDGEADADRNRVAFVAVRPFSEGAPLPLDQPDRIAALHSTHRLSTTMFVGATKRSSI